MLWQLRNEGVVEDMVKYPDSGRVIGAKALSAMRTSLRGIQEEPWTTGRWLYETNMDQGGNGLMGLAPRCLGNWPGWREKVKGKSMSGLLLLILKHIHKPAMIFPNTRPLLPGQIANG